MQLQKSIGFYPGNFYSEIRNTLVEIINWKEISYIAQGTNVERNVFPYIIETYTYSLTLLFVSLLIALLFAITLTTSTFYFSSKAQKAVKFVLNLLEALPDVFVVFSLQLGAIWIFKNTSLLITEPYALSGQKIYFLPILTLSLIPTIYLYKSTLMMYEQELNKPYVELGIAKGLDKLYILLRHIFPNVLLSFFYNLKYIYLMMISNVIILEYMYNIFGLLKFMINHPTYEIITVGILLLTIPLFVAFFLIDALLPKGVVYYDQKAVL
ncbi:ABC transporter permease subunit [Bacillus sp. BHET2]|uniref:ABC transporter permease subunit n=1 Tax=Bacillus sp. BHET2 TaxID=2583818 RepID=UPI001485FA67|nr:ABC transporter permease subunit [Bacillus sp. BHET2]